jgi:predicted phage terminase large subunit-like protein
VHPDDLTGHVMKTEPGQWVQVSIPACNESTHEVLDESLHTFADFMKMKKRDPITYYRQYQQKDKTREGLLYRPFATYNTLPIGLGRVRALCDPKDKGTDYLADVFYRLQYIKGKPAYAFVVDIVYTQNPPEETEVEVARKVKHWRVEKHVTEANNGGRYFSRNLKDKCVQLNHRATEFVEYTQRKNKETRILTQAANVNNFFIFPANWQDEHYQAYKSMEYFLATGKNLHDDLQDALTAIYEREVVYSEAGVTQTN